MVVAVVAAVVAVVSYQMNHDELTCFQADQS